MHAIVQQMDEQRKTERRLRKSSSTLSPEKLAAHHIARKALGSENGDDVVSESVRALAGTI